MSPIIYTNNNNSDEGGKKFIQYGELKDKYDISKKVVTKEFPMCFKLISDLFDCERLNSIEPSSSKFMINNPCKTQFVLLDYCMYSSFCPSESKLLMDCTNNIIPDNETPLPLKCWEYFNSFEKCIQKKLKEFEG